jgi:type VI secretion system protein VasD
MAVLASFTHRMRRRAAHVLVGLGLSIGLAVGAFGIGCAQAPPPAAPKPCDVQIVTLRIYAADNINPNENQNPRSVVIRLYQLKDEVIVFPNDLVEVKFERVKEASVLAGVALFHSPKGQSWKTFYTFPLKPGEAQCAGREGDAGPVADPRVSFFVESTKLDNGSEFDESMFPNATSVRKVNLPKKSADNGAKPASSAP